MPTYDKTAQFMRDEKALSPEQKKELRAALKKFLEDLPSRKFRKGLRVRGVESAEGVYEMTWAGDGRITFEYGSEVIPGEPHVSWRRVGDHSILDAT